MDRPGQGRRRLAAATLRVALETERLVLEPTEPKHAAGIYDAIITSQAELLPWMPWAVDPTLDGVTRHTHVDVADWSAGREYQFAVIDQADGLVLGVAGLNCERPDAPELHYWIRTDHAGRGLTTEACRALIGWARDTLRVDRVTLWAGRDNAASRRVAEKLGFTHIGPLDWRPDGGMGNFDAESYELALGS